MKTFIAVMLSVFLISSTLWAQFKHGNVELSLMGSAGSFTKSITESSSGNGSFSGTSSNSDNYFVVAFTCGIYIFDRFSIEPEIGLVAIEHSAPGESIIGNLAYTYPVPDSKIALFVRGGYGTSNSFLYPITESLPLRWSDKFDIGILTAGAGIKCLITDRAIFKIEMNYRKQSYTYQNSYTDGYYNYSTKSYMSYTYTQETDYTYSNIGILLGLSLIL
jgi:hypothetical protein